MDNKAIAYFASINPLARKIVQETQLAKNILHDDWEELSLTKQEEALDDFFVDRKVRSKYDSTTKENQYPVSFPRLFVQSGEKIIVDMDSDIWSWQDTHSAPFSWRSKSQQDLTLIDLDPEKLSKAQPSKGANRVKTEQENEGSVLAPNEFMYKSEPSIWETEKYRNWKSDLQNYSCALPEVKDTVGKKLVDFNARNSCVSESAGSEGRPAEVDDQEIPEAFPQASNYKRPSKKSLTRSPVSTRLKLSSSFSKRRQEEKEDLVADEVPKKDYPKAHKDLENNVFDNPVMNIQGPNMVDEETESISSTTSSPSRKPLLREPASQTMERDVRGQDMFDGVRKTLDITDDRTGLLEEVTEFHGSVLSGPDTITPDQSEEPSRPTSEVPTTGFDFLDDW